MISTGTESLFASPLCECGHTKERHHRHIVQCAACTCHSFRAKPEVVRFCPPYRLRFFRAPLRLNRWRGDTGYGTCGDGTRTWRLRMYLWPFGVIHLIGPEEKR